MREYLSLGPAPFEEECAQVGQDDYPERSQRECKAYAHQLLRQFSEQGDRPSFYTKSFEHNFGTYREVVVYYNDNSEEEVGFAYMVEEKMPKKWDDEAQKELGIEVM